MQPDLELTFVVVNSRQLDAAATAETLEGCNCVVAKVVPGQKVIVAEE